MFRSHRRTVLTAAALIATTTLLAGCQDGDTEGKKAASSGHSGSEAKEGSGKEASGNDTEASGGGNAPADTTAESKSDSGKVTGTWFGTVAYLAPGKYTVSDLKGTKQQFFTSTDTNIQGAGKICGDAAGQAAEPCSEDELEVAAKDGVSAKVKLKDGVAVSVIEDHSNNNDDDKTSGLWSGKLAYLAPGKYSVVNDEGERAFVTSAKTVINGAGWICGDREQIKQCSEAELEAAAKNSVSVAVKVDHGIAVTIDENHN